MKALFTSIALLTLGLVSATLASAADAERQAIVAERGKDVMPFSLQATTHIFTPTTTGGNQRVVAKKVNDTKQVALVRRHLKEIKTQFEKGDFSGPAHIHGQEMPALAALQAAQPGQIQIAYRDVKGGADLTYKTANPDLVTALHAWFDAQLSDHGADAMSGHAHHHPMGTSQ